MKRDFLKNSAWFIIIGLILLIGNIVLDLGVLPLEGVKRITVLLWVLTVLSKICSTVGLALIVGFITKLVNSSREEEQIQKDDERHKWEERIEETLKNKLSSQAYSRESLEILNDQKKQDIINNCLLPSCSEKQKYYLLHKVSQLNGYNKLHVRSNIDYITTASKENGIVKLHTVMSYRLYKTNSGYPEIIHCFNKSSAKVVSMSILYGDNINKKKCDILESELCIKEETIHQKEKYYVNKVNIPQSLKDESSITLKITVEEEGYDHWAHLVWMSWLYPQFCVNHKCALSKIYKLRVHFSTFRAYS